MRSIDIALEEGEKKAFAIAMDWPGWCRSGREEASALRSLLDYGPRYAKVMELEKIPFQIPSGLSPFRVIERAPGSTTTDYGAPDILFSRDNAPVDEETVARLQKILSACWRAFAGVAESAVGKELQKGPRGGGRDLEKMISHVVEAEAAYLSRLGWWQQQRARPARAGKSGSKEDGAKSGGAVSDGALRIEQIQQASLAALAESARGELPKQGPRGGKIWPVRFYVRRSAWHILDHAWEIEDRML